MPDLSKLPWDECALPEFRGHRATVCKAPAGDFAFIECDGFIPVASQIESVPGRWRYVSATVDEIEQIAKMCRIVENFIKEHS